MADFRTSVTLSVIAELQRRQEEEPCERLRQKEEALWRQLEEQVLGDRHCGCDRCARGAQCDRFLCGLCEREFESEGALKGHGREAHLDIPCFPCVDPAARTMTLDTLSHLKRR
jgi:hypothetical protein